MNRFQNLTLDQWQEHVESYSAATPFHHRNWIELLAEQYRFQVAIPALVDGDGVRAALPFLETRSLRGSRKLVSLPFTDCMRILARSDECLPEFATELQKPEFHQGRPVVTKTDRPIFGDGSDGCWYRHELNTNRSAEGISSNYPSSLRRNLKRATKNRLEFQRRTDLESLEYFYRLHLRTRRKLGVPIQPKSYFRRLARWILEPGFGYIGVVRQGDAPVAAGIFLTFNGTMVYKYGASEPTALEVRPNEFMFSQVIRIASEEGFRCLDFGVTHERDEGLRRFKRKWGATESPVYYSCLTDASPQAPEDSVALRLASGAIRRSPTFVCRALGEVFYRYSQ